VSVDALLGGEPDRAAVLGGEAHAVVVDGARPLEAPFELAPELVAQLAAAMS